jgi:hypothetical protein
MWAQRFGPQNDQTGGSIAADLEGNVVVAGCFQGAIDFGGGCAPLNGGVGTTTFFLARLSPSGECIWSKSFQSGGEGEEGCDLRVAADASGVVFAASVQGLIDLGGETLPSAGSTDIVVAKLAADGSHLWSKRYGDTSFQVLGDVAFDTLGNVLLAGAFVGEINFGVDPTTALKSATSETYDAFVAKLDPAGARLWSHQLTGTSNNYALGVAGDADGNVLVSGWFDGTIAVGALAPQSTAGSFDIFVAKFGR